MEFLQERKKSQLLIRIGKDEKCKLKEMAKDCGMTVTDLIMNSLKGIALSEYKYKRELFKYIHNLTREMNFIGNNINQVTMVIHMIKKNRKIEEGDFKEFNVLFKEYLEKTDQLKNIIEKMLYK